jgi:hypothetical protein
MGVDDYARMSLAVNHMSVRKEDMGAYDESGTLLNFSAGVTIYVRDGTAGVQTCWFSIITLIQALVDNIVAARHTHRGEHECQTEDQTFQHTCSLHPHVVTLALE